jgi:hypothetical protein
MTPVKPSLLRVSGACMVLVLVLMSCAGLAQEQTGTVEGHVLDSSGVAIPMATITATSAAVQGGSKTVQSDGEGYYRLAQLPVGSYDLSVASSGFATESYKDVRVHAATTITLNSSLPISSRVDQVLVSAATPMIETAQTDNNYTFTKQTMENVPNARDPWAMLSQVPGVTTSTVNVGGSQTGSQPSFYGLGADPTQATYLLNGANVTDNTDNGASQLYFDVDGFSEMQIQMNSHGADVQTPGIVMNIIPKSGSNQFHGEASSYFSSQGMETNNLNSALRAIGGTSSSLHQYLDYGGNFGGYIIKDKLWFYGGHRYQAIQKLITGTVTANGTTPIDKFHLWFPSGKVNWQINKSNNFSFYTAFFQKVHNNNNLSSTRPLDTTVNQVEAPIGRLFTYRDDYTVSPKLVLSFKVFTMDQGFEYLPPAGVDTLTTPVSYDQATGVYANAPPYLYGISKSLRTYGGSGNYLGGKVLGGSHELKFGGDYTHYRVFGNQHLNGGTALYVYPDNTELIYNNGKPLQVTEYAPSAEDVGEPTWNWWVQDGYTYKRLRLDLGLRYDWQANKLNAVTAPQSQYLPAVTQSATGNLITWSTFAPRIGGIYDVFGKAKTLLKASYDRYYYQLWTTYGQAASTAGVRSYTYAWNNPTNAPFNVNQLGALLTHTDPSATPVTIDPGLKATHTDEFTVGLSQEVMRNLAINVEGIFRKDRDIPWSINTNLSPTDYTVVNGVDPGPTGVKGGPGSGNILKFYNLAAADTKFSSPNFETTRYGYSQEYTGFQIQVIRRFDSGFQLIGSYTRGEEFYNYGLGSYQNPQDIYFENGARLSSSRPNVFKVSGSKELPRRFLVSGSYDHLSGPNYTRTVTSTSAGVTLNQGAVTVLSGFQNVHSYNGQDLLDFRVGYTQPIHERLKASFYVDTFNLLNINTVDNTTVTSGSKYGYVADFIAPRLFRVGAKIVF